MIGKITTSNYLYVITAFCQADFHDVSLSLVVVVVISK
jgi:hypothetical protein